MIKNEMRILTYFSLLLIFAITLVSAHTQEELAESKAIIDANTSCDNLSEKQIELLGDYYMEQMHPGESHELMHQMMGGEDSELTKSMHIQMAKTIYCSESNGMGMMGSGMMQSYYQKNPYSDFINILITVLLIGLIILIFVLIIKLLKNKRKK